MSTTSHYQHCSAASWTHYITVDCRALPTGWYRGYSLLYTISISWYWLVECNVCVCVVCVQVLWEYCLMCSMMTTWCLRSRSCSGEIRVMTVNRLAAELLYCLLISSTSGLRRTPPASRERECVYSCTGQWICLFVTLARVDCLLCCAVLCCGNQSVDVIKCEHALLGWCSVYTNTLLGWSVISASRMCTFTQKFQLIYVTNIHRVTSMAWLYDGRLSSFITVIMSHNLILDTACCCI